MNRRQFLKSLGFGLIAPVAVSKASQNPEALSNVTWTDGERGHEWWNREKLYFSGVVGPLEPADMINLELAQTWEEWDKDFKQSLSRERQMIRDSLTRPLFINRT